MESPDSAQRDRSASIPERLSVDRDAPADVLGVLPAALLFSCVGVFLGANALLARPAVLLRSLPVAAACFGILALFCVLLRVLRSPAYALVACFGLLLATVYGPQAWTVPLLTALLVLASVHTLWNLCRPLREIPIALGMSLVGTLTILGTRHAYTSFDMIERLHAGNVSLDTLYHASMAAMIKNYGVTSTGLNGLVETPYHALSHALFAVISLVSRAPVVEVYGIATWMLFAPLLLYAASASCVMLREGARPDAARIWTCVCLILVFAPLTLERWALWDSFFVSESYLVALSLLLLGLPLLLAAQLRPAGVALIVALTALLCGAKAPVGVVFIGLFGARLVLLNGRFKLAETAAWVAMIAVGVAVVVRSAVANRASVSIGPGEFIEQYSALGRYLSAAHQAVLGVGTAGARAWVLAAASLGSFVVLHFALTWLLVITAVARLGVRSALRSPIVVLALCATAAGMVIVALFRIYGGSAYYFTNVAFFVSLPAAAGLLAELPRRQRIANWQILSAAAVLVALASARAYWNASALNGDRAQGGRSALITRLLDVRRSLPRKVILEADRSMLKANPFSLCLARPFVFPAVSERPWIGVIADSAGCLSDDYGLDSYRSYPGSRRMLPPPSPPSGWTVLHEALP
ncbi:MAG TPA: hypothetical protein VHZ53_05025 [Steroidobacteraceae bacterium]|jgi:hypothetical protein|nr:hypothetical protein [Steroidobacteraceae bacterium]